VLLNIEITVVCHCADQKHLRDHALWQQTTFNEAGQSGDSSFCGSRTCPFLWPIDVIFLGMICGKIGGTNQECLEYLGISWNYIDLDTPSEFQLDGCFEKRTLKEPESQGCSQAKNWHRHSTRNGLATGASQPERVGNTSWLMFGTTIFLCFWMVVAADSFATKHLTLLI